MELANLAQAAQLHAHLIKTARSDDSEFIPVGRLLAFSALHSSGDLAYARSIFDSLQKPTSSFCANTMIRAYAKRSPDPYDALRLFSALQLSCAGPPPDKFTFPFLFHACARLRSLPRGRELHGLAAKVGVEQDRFVRNSLIHMYGVCGDLDSALEVFDRMVERDVVSWTAIIDGAADGEQPQEALRMFKQMRGEALLPNDATIVSVLAACAELGAIASGQEVHEIARSMGLDSKPNVATALLDMYAKCGCIESAREVFEGIAEKDVFVWTAMINGLASHGLCREAVDLFLQMREVEKIQLDDRTITAVLSACRNAGWVREGYRFFNGWKKSATGGPKMQHYGCMVDMLARAGHLKDAEEFMKGMPFEPDAIMWRTLIWAAKVHGDTTRAERLLNERPSCGAVSADSGDYTLANNVYAASGQWEEKARVRRTMEQNQIMKPPGCSRIELNGMIHEFKAGDSSHPEAKSIYVKWAEVQERLKQEGFCPKVSEVLLDMEDAEKAAQLQHHSEKLAVAFGLINTSPGEKILVVKNLRSCEDCHSAMKLVSKIYDREIIIRDRIRFHYFRDGACSCGDLW